MSPSLEGSEAVCVGSMFFNDPGSLLSTSAQSFNHGLKSLYRYNDLQIKSVSKLL